MAGSKNGIRGRLSQSWRWVRGHGAVATRPAALLSGLLIAMAVFVALTWGLQLLPDAWGEAGITTATIMLVAATGGLVWATHRFVQEAARERRAMIRPVVVFRNDFPNYPRAALVNVGNGVALNIRGWAITQDRRTHLPIEVASIGRGESHFPEPWYQYLVADPEVQSFAVTYEDAEGTLYHTVGRPKEWVHRPWRVGQGAIPEEMKPVGDGSLAEVADRRQR